MVLEVEQPFIGPARRVFPPDLGLTGCNGQLLDEQAETCSRQPPFPLAGS